MENKRILVMEKEAIDGAYVRNMLERIGWVAEVVRDCEQALLRMAQVNFDAVLLSSSFLVGESANALTQQLHHATEGAMPVIGIANHSLSIERQRFNKAGIDNFLTKPIYQRSLSDALDLAIARPA